MAGDGFFVKFNSEIMHSLEVAGQASSNIYVQAVAALISGAVTLYVLWMGYQTLAGKIKTPMEDVLWTLAKFGLILAFINNTSGYLTATLDAVEGLKNGLSGNESGGVWAKLDSLWEQTQRLASTIKAKDTSTYVKVEGGLGAMMVWTGSVILMAISALVFFAADVTLLMLGLTAPLFIFCLMFGFLRTMFNNWLQLIFSSILTVMFASLVINIGMKFMSLILIQVTAQAAEANLLTMGAMALMAGVLTGGMVLLARLFATQIAGVGLEGAVQGMAVMGLGAAAWGASKLLSNGADKGKQLGKGLGKGISGNQEKTGSVTEAAGRLAGKTLSPAYKAGMAMSKQAVANMKARYQK